MFAVIKTGGKQYRVARDDVIVVEKLAGEPGTTLEFQDVLMIGEPGRAPSVGLPVLDKAAVFAEVVDQTRGDKIIVFKKLRRKNHRRKKGHRQDLTVLRITGISATGTKPAAKAKAKAKPAAKPAAEPKAETAKAPAKEAKAETAAKPKAETTAKPKAETKAKVPAEAKAPAKAEAKALAKPKTKPKTKPKAKPKAKE
jgi:large subunit ribosomal protein L21